VGVIVDVDVDVDVMVIVVGHRVGLIVARGEPPPGVAPARAPRMNSACAFPAPIHRRPFAAMLASDGLVPRPIPEMAAPSVAPPPDRRPCKVGNYSATHARPSSVSSPLGEVSHTREALSTCTCSSGGYQPSSYGSVGATSTWSQA
jgi:hypothetical protein